MISISALVVHPHRCFHLSNYTSSKDCVGVLRLRLIGISPSCWVDITLLHHFYWSVKFGDYTKFQRISSRLQPEHKSNDAEEVETCVGVCRSATLWLKSKSCTVVIWWMCVCLKHMAEQTSAVKNDQHTEHQVFFHTSILILGHTAHWL